MKVWLKPFCQNLFFVYYLVLVIRNTGASLAGSQESACNAGDKGSIPGSGRSPGEGHGSLLQYSCLENSMGIRIIRGSFQSFTYF